jgi:hypothetical protein
LFNLEYSPDNFIGERIDGKPLDPELCNMPEWEQLNLVINMLKQCETNNWDNIKKHFEELKRQRIGPILLKYAKHAPKSMVRFMQETKTIPSTSSAPVVQCRWK